MGRVKCPDNTIVTKEECIACKNPCTPLPIRLSIFPKSRQRKNLSKPWFGVTRLATNCLRKSYYELTEDVIHDFEQHWIFNRGHAIHNHITTALSDEEKEVKLIKDFPAFGLIGFIDALHNNIVYEFKTTNNIPNEPQESHIFQAQAYYSMLNKELQDKIKKIVIVYLSLQKIVEFEVPKRDITLLLEEHGKLLARALKLKIPPNPSPSWLCSYCNFREMCDEYEKNRKSTNNTFISKQSTFKEL